MKKGMIYVALVLWATATVAQGNYTATQEIKGTINHIKVLSEMNVMVKEGSANSVAISKTGADEIKNPICKVQSNTLTIENTNADISNVNVVIVLEEPLELFSIEVTENVNLIVEGGAYSESVLKVEVGNNSNVMLKGSWEIMDYARLVTKSNSNLSIDRLEVIPSAKFEIVAGDASNITVKKGNISEWANFNYEISNASNIKIGKTNINQTITKTTTLSEDYESNSTEDGNNVVISDNTYAKLPENSNKDCKDKSKSNFESILSVGLSYLSAANNPRSFSNAFNTGNTDLAIEGGTRWYFHFLVPIEFSRHFALNVGIGMEFNWFSFEKDVTSGRLSNGDRYLYAMNGVAYPTYIMPNLPSLNDYEANLYAQYFTLPLIFEWRPAENFGLNFGVIGGLKYFSLFKTYFEIDKVKFREKFTDYNNINPLKADLTLGFSVNRFSVNFRYALIPLFKSGREEIVYPFSIGLCWGI